MIFLMSASQVARIIDMSHWHPVGSQILTCTVKEEKRCPKVLADCGEMRREARMLQLPWGPMGAV
jgi:hypothetical protein